MRSITIMPHALAIVYAAFAVFLGCTSKPSEDPGTDAGSQPAPRNAAETAEAANAVSGSRKAAGRSKSLIQPGDLVYRGAFRLTEASNGSNWEYSGYAMTYCPAGDPDGPEDGYPGSLFAIGHDHHQQVSEIAIPVPVISRSKEVADLNTAETLQGFHDIRNGFYGQLEIPRAGLEYLPPQGGQRTGKLHFAWGQHFEDDRAPTHGWCELALSAPDPAGPWSLCDHTNYITNDYLFEIPEQWAAKNTPGLRLATGRFRDGTWGGLGPALLAYGPWTEGNPPPPKSTLRNVRPLLLYGAQEPNAVEIGTSPDRKMADFKEADEWSGGGWLTADNKSAVVFVGTKATGRSWYGFANGVVYPTSGDPNEPIPEVPPWPYDSRGWWSEGIQAQILFYDPDDLAAVARGEMETWEPQPYASLGVDKYLFDPGFNHERPKRYLLGAAAFDRARGFLYLMERRADEDKSIVHVFDVGD